MERYGVVLKKLDLIKEAIDVLGEAVHKEPLFWGAWYELATLVVDKDMVRAVEFHNEMPKSHTLYLSREVVDLSLLPLVPYDNISHALHSLPDTCVC